MWTTKLYTVPSKANGVTYTNAFKENGPPSSLRRDFLQLKKHFDELATFREAVVAGFAYRDSDSPNASLTVFPLSGNYTHPAISSGHDGRGVRATALSKSHSHSEEGQSPDSEIRLGVVFSSAVVELIIHLTLDGTDEVLVLASDEEGPGIGEKQIDLALTAVSEWLGPVLQPKAFVARLTGRFDGRRDLENLGWFFEPAEQERKYPTINRSASHESTRPALFWRTDWNKKAEILTAGPSIGPLEASFVDRAVMTGWNQHHSDFLSRFESAFADYVGSEYAMATSSCTGALHLALLACGVGEGDEVIVPEITWVASGSAVRYCGATPVFVDVERNSWTLDESSLRQAITAKTKAIIPVHLYGVPANMDAILSVAVEHDLVVVEDAAPAIGATWAGQKVGTFGAVGCYSFQGAKMLVTGEGGMFVTDDREIFARAKKLQEHGRRPGTFWIEELGYKYKMSNLQAALGLAQLLRVDNQIDKKRLVNSWYRDFLDGENGIAFQSSDEQGFSIDWMTSISLNSGGIEERQALMDYLRSEGIDSRPVFPQMSTFDFWRRQRTSANPVASDIGATGINLPSGVSLSRTDVERVCSSVRGFLSTSFEEQTG